MQDGLLSKEDKKLPLACHVISIFQYLNLIQYVISGVFVWPEEVVIGNPESQIIVGTVDVIKTIRRPVRSLVGTVQPFNHLLERTEFSGYLIVVGKSNYLSDLKLKFFTKLMEELGVVS